MHSPPNKTQPPVLSMLDDFTQLGYLPSIENAMPVARAFGVQLWSFLQDPALTSWSRSPGDSSTARGTPSDKVLEPVPGRARSSASVA
jgi:TraM recognition site of TraD and TraG